MLNDKGSPRPARPQGSSLFRGVAIMHRPAAIFSLLFLLLPALALGETGQLPGIWWSAEEGVQLTLRSDGTLSIAAKESVQDGHWSAAGEELRLSLKPPGSTEEIILTCRYRLEGKRLTILPGDRQCGENSFERLS
jgi:hypothetical protein